MTAAALLAELRNRGASVAIVGDRLRVEAPAGTVTPAMRQAIADHKAELLAVLTGPADCLELLEVMHADLRAEYIEGALPWALASVPELARRFYETAGAIDRLAGTRPTEADFRAALEAHANVWREIVARYRAHRERQAEKAGTMPKLTSARCFSDDAPVHIEPNLKPNRTEMNDAALTSSARRVAATQRNPKQQFAGQPGQIGEKTMGLKMTDLFPSRFTKAADLTGDTYAVIDKIDSEILGNAGDKKLTAVLHFRNGLKPLPLNKTNFTTCVKLLGPDTDTWPGKAFMLVVEQVSSPNGMVDGIRIRPARQAAAKPTTKPAAPLPPDTDADWPDDEPPADYVEGCE